MPQLHFLLDQNVAKSVQEALIGCGHTCEFSRALIPSDADDPIVAIAAEQTSAILVSHDTDFNKIAPRVIKGLKNRFRKLSRIGLECPEWMAADRLVELMPVIEHLIALSENKPDKRVIIFIQQHTMRTA